MTSRWIEWECPVTGVDFDEFTIVGPDSLLHCPDCSARHRAGDVGHLLVQHGHEVMQPPEYIWRMMVREPRGKSGET